MRLVRSALFVVLCLTVLVSLARAATGLQEPGCRQPGNRLHTSPDDDSSSDDDMYVCGGSVRSDGGVFRFSGEYQRTVHFRFRPLRAHWFFGRGFPLRVGTSPYHRGVTDTFLFIAIGSVGAASRDLTYRRLRSGRGITATRRSREVFQVFLLIEAPSKGPQPC